MAETLEQKVRQILGRCEVPPDGLRLVEHDFLQEIADALAAMSWQPIETAPKDGRSVLLARGEDVQSAHFETRPVTMWRGDYGVCTGKPTHWMPLPTPPVQQSTTAIATDRTPTENAEAG